MADAASNPPPPNTTDRFYCVWCPQTHLPITRWWPNIRQAIHARDELKGRVPDRDFHIMANIPEDVVAAIMVSKDKESDKAE